VSIASEADPVLTFLAETVDTGALRPGGRLPTERELVEKTGVGRRGVRKALAQLEAEGRIIRHVGRGTFLAGGVGSPPGNEASPAEVMAVRLLLEPQVVALVTTSATPRDLERIEHCLRRADAATGFEDFELWDGALHHAITEATHNRFLLSLFALVDSAREDPLWGTLKQRSFNEERRVRYQMGHRAIVEALRKRDPDAAAEAMRAHLIDVRANLLGPS
jgi:DNA-binding FadR family transcriptional regulator